MLQAIQPGATPEKAIPIDPDRTCEACGTAVPGSTAINIMMQIGVAGHPSIMPFQCPLEEHWACSRDCWLKVAHACIDEHMHPLLAHRHGQVGR